MLEIENKYPVADFAPIQQKLTTWGARAEAAHQEADYYFNAPDRDFARTDEALRVRRIGDSNRVTYKGPKRDAQTKTRTEIEVPLANGAAVADDFCRLLTFLKYRPTAVVRKERTAYHLERRGFRLEITLDRVDGLGLFVEVEILAAQEQLAAAKEVLLAVAADLGLSAPERRSYLEMLLAQG